MARKISRRGLIAKVDKAFSRFIRKQAADHAGWCECVTCHARLPIEEIQAGHWVKRGHSATRWDERNVYPQCAPCNLYHSGKQDEMAAYIALRHGPDTLLELIRLKHTEKRWTMAELRELLEKYQER